jgi:hypothetical protein
VKTDREEAKFWIEQGLKVGLIIWGVHKVGSYIGGLDIFGEPGRTDKVDFDFKATQERRFPIGNNQFEIVSDPWTPNDLANQLHSNMKGWFGGSSEFKRLMDEVKRLGKDRARWLHNYWLDEIDGNDTLYRWIRDESPGTADGIREKQIVIYFLKDWGIGW